MIKAQNQSTSFLELSETIKTNSKDPNIPNQKVKPRVRFWARALDRLIIVNLILAFCLFLIFTIGHFSSHSYSELFSSYYSENKANPSLFGFIVGFISLIIIEILTEAIFISFFGATFGKWLLQIKVRNMQGEKIPFSVALKRSWLVLYRGCALNIPLINFFTYIAGYRKLTKKKITTWDKDLNLQITHKKIGIVRLILTIISFIVAGISFVILKNLLQ